MTHHTHTKGDIGVAKVTTDLIEKGFNVFFPFHSFLPFDIIGYKDEISYRIQVKYKKAKNSVLQLSIVLPPKTRYTSFRIDVFLSRYTKRSCTVL